MRKEKKVQNEAKVVLPFKRPSVRLRADRSDDVAGDEGVYSEILGKREKIALWHRDMASVIGGRAGCSRLRKRS